MLTYRLALTHANAANADSPAPSSARSDYSAASLVSFASPIKSPMSRNLIRLFLSGKKTPASRPY